MWNMIDVFIELATRASERRWKMQIHSTSFGIERIEREKGTHTQSNRFYFNKFNLAHNVYQNEIEKLTVHAHCIRNPTRSRSQTHDVHATITCWPDSSSTRETWCQDRAPKYHIPFKWTIDVDRRQMTIPTIRSYALYECGKFTSRILHAPNNASPTQRIFHLVRQSPINIWMHNNLK